jgi:hypothetical protein
LQQGGVLLDLRCLDQDHALLEQLEHLAAGHTPSRQ